MMYRTSKLAREIAEYLGLNIITVWDVLDELNFKAQELSPKDVMRWTFRVVKFLNIN